MSGAAIAAEIAAALGEVGDETGAGKLEATISRRGVLDESTTPPTLGPDQTFTFTAMISQFTTKELASGNVQSGDTKFILSEGETDPRNDDSIIVDNIEYEIEGVDRVAPGGVTLMWKVHARGGRPVTG
ncbi:hypothetical protein GCM10007385_35480 [Tateyamaria omphalii]|uniref:hypothetical protein n=1 Tax=Tateyamaria omphalii TaxID=299262 RepID=UPI0016752959|nr:hypothetical protein [Tateyamaria omphalii]GGX63252.1 hypothetical protein GCM10007385_35480 [Tateyamaria omphalii]